MRNHPDQPRLMSLKQDSGGALLAALILVVVSGIMGATILFATSTDIQISGNFRRAVQTFYAAEAGLAETQRRLAGFPATNPWFGGDPSAIPQPNWSAYLLAIPSWNIQNDTTYSTQFTNYVPMNGNFVNTAITLNSVQTSLSYWTKIRHKTEFDAEQAGHAVSSLHYVDADGITTTHSKTNRGNLIRFGYPIDSLDRPVQFSSNLPTLYAPVEMITSQGEVEGAMAVIQAELAHRPGPPIAAPVYVGNHISLLGNSIEIGGEDACGIFPAGRPPISLGPLASVEGTGTLTGNPATPHSSLTALDLSLSLDELKSGGEPMLGDLSGSALGSVAAPTVQIAEPFGGGVTLTNVTGYGLLLVKGSLRVNPPFLWEGMIVVVGQMTLEPSSSPVLIRGAVFAETLEILSHNVSITLDTCPIGASLRMVAPKVLSWRQIL